MKAVGVTGPDFMPRLFDISEPIAAPDGVVVDVMAGSVNDFDRAAVRGRHHDLTDQLDAVLLGRDFVGRVHVAGDRSVVASVVWPGGRFTSVTDVSISATRGAGYVPTIVAPNGHKLASPMRSIRVVTTPRAASSSHAEQLSRTG